MNLKKTFVECGQSCMNVAKALNDKIQGFFDPKMDRSYSQEEILEKLRPFENMEETLNELTAEVVAQKEGFENEIKAHTENRVNLIKKRAEDFELLRQAFDKETDILIDAIDQKTNLANQHIEKCMETLESIEMIRSTIKHDE